MLETLTLQVDPQKMFAAALASAHVLSIHRQRQVQPRGDTQLLDHGQRAQPATATAEARLHELAHEHCFIANSVKTKMTVRPP